MFKRKQSIEAEPLLPPERAPIKEEAPEYSEEALRIIDWVDNSLADSERLLKGLEEIDREQVAADPKAFEGIYAFKQIGKLGLEKYDASMFEASGKGRIRSLISKYALKGEEGVTVDTRKLKEEARDQEYDLTADELKRLKKFGLNPEEINPQDFKTIFVEGKKGVEKVILQRKTEEEMAKIAGNILKKQLEQLETRNGANLIKKKDDLEILRKEKKRHQDILDEEDMARLNDEEINMQEMIEIDQEELNSDLEIFKEPRQERLIQLTEALDSFSYLLQGVTAQEKDYKGRVNGLQNKIIEISGTSQLKEALKEKIILWQEEKKQAEANLKIVREKKADLNKRINELKKSQAEVNAVLTRINNIGKTKAEQRREKEAEKEQKRREKGQQRPEDIVRQLNRLDAGETEAEGGQPAEIFSTISAFTGKPIKVEKLGENRVAVVRPPRPEIDDDNNPPSPPEETKPEQREKNIKTTGDWLSLLKIQSNTPTKKNLIEKYFVVGDKKFNAAASMTVAEVRRACIGFYGEAEGLKANLAKKKFEKKLYDIRKN